MLRPVVVGMIMAAALLLIFPHSEDGRSFIDGWSWLIFIVTLYAAVRKINPILLIILSGVAGIAIYGF